MTRYLLVGAFLLGLLAGDLRGQGAKSPPTDGAFGKASLFWTIPWDADWVTATTFLGDSRRLAVGNKLGQILVFDLPEKATRDYPPPARRLDGHANMITALTSTPDGRWLISSSYDHTVRLWDMQSPEKGKGKAVLAGAGKKKTKSGRTDEYDVGVQEANKVLTAHKEWVRSLSLSQDGKRLLTGDDTGLCILWDLDTGKDLARWQVQGWLTAVALSPDAKQAVTCEYAPRYAGFKNAIKLWDATSGTSKLDLSPTFKTNQGTKGMAAAAFSRDGKLLALGQGGEAEAAGVKAYLVSPADGKKVRELAGHQYGVTALGFHPDGKHIATAGRDTLVRLWRIADGKQVAELGKGRGGQFKDWIHSVAFTSDGRWLAAGDMAGFVHVWKLFE